MLRYWSIEGIELKKSWLTIGSFDGVHLGHQSVLREMVEKSHAEGVPAVVLTFYPHPGLSLGKRKGAFYLSTPEEKTELLAEFGVDLLIFQPFNEHTATLSAQDFISDLIRRLGLKRLFIGRDFALGHNRAGDLKMLRQLGDDLGFRVEEICPTTLDGRVISSSWVREALANGDLKSVRRLLGRDYQVEGEVVHGEGRGRTLGIPTANLEVWHERALPKLGVYLSMTRIDGKDVPGVVNVGFRPTFDHRSALPLVEVHLLDFHEDLYQRRLSLIFLDRLRDERKFSGVQDLVNQIQSDIQRARSMITVKTNETVPRVTSENP